MSFTDSSVARRFIPFGSHWNMGIDVPYSLAVLDRGRFWSCGQCPLDLHAMPLYPGDLGLQLRLVADLIRRQFEPHGIGPDRITKLVAYVAQDGSTALEAVEEILQEALGPMPLVLTIGVPNFYYAGMMVEIDVYGSLDAPSRIDINQLSDCARATAIGFGGGIHARLELVSGAEASTLEQALCAFLAKRGSSMDEIVSARVFLDRNVFTAPLAKSIATTLGIDTGAAILADLPEGRAAVVDLIAAVDTTGMTRGDVRESVDLEGVHLVERRGGGILGLAARCVGPEVAPAAATHRIMEALSGSLARHGLGFADVVKQQAYYVGGESEEDLYANMRIRNGVL